MSDELSLMVSALKAAGRAVLSGTGSVHDKDTVVGVHDVVSDADVCAERIIIDAIRNSFPDDNIMSEEINPESLMEGRTWIVDPIDGTMNYTRGIPLYGIQAVFTVDGVPSASAIYFPAQDEMFTASPEGAFLNGECIRTADYTRLDKCILSLGDFSRKSETFREAQGRILCDCRDQVARFKVLGAACMDFAYLASARTDLHIRFTNKPWDFLPGMYLAEMAGAVYDEDLYKNHSILVMCSCKEVLDEALEGLVPKFICSFHR